MGLASRKLPTEVPLKSLGSHPLEVSDIPTCVWEVQFCKPFAAVCHKGKKEKKVYRNQEENPSSICVPLGLCIDKHARW